MSALRLAVFDLDGTLVELEFGHLAEEIERIFLALSATPPPSEQIYSLVRQHQLFHSIPERDRESFINSFWSMYRYHERPGARLIEGALQCIEALAELDYEIVIATARTEAADLVYEYLQPTGLEKHLSFITTFNAQPDWKDKTEQLLNLCKKFSVSPQQAFMVGDHPKDMVSAKKAEFALKVGVLSGESEESILREAGADHIIQHVGELSAILDGHQGSSERLLMVN